jgi:hypothetical protein
MLDRARQLLSAECEEIAARVSLVEATGEEAPAALPGTQFVGVLCHGVLMYLEDPAPLARSLAALAQDGGVVSVAAKNARVLAVRPALAGDWKAAMASFDATRQVNGLGVDTRSDTVEGLGELLATCGIDTVAWYGVRLFTDGWSQEPDAVDAEDDVLAVELEASRRDPYRQLSRLFHLIGVRRVGDAVAWSNKS